MPSRQQALALAAACLPLSLTACGADNLNLGETTNTAASCAAVLRVDGKDYLGIGGLRRDPPVTGEEVEAVMPGCDDTGGEAPTDETVSAQVLSEVDSDTALLYEGAVYVREGRDAPEQLQQWRTAPKCDTEGTFELSGTWLGAQGAHKPNYDGDIQPPYRITMHVDDGPEQYEKAEVVVHAETETSPALDADDVKSTLWTGGTVTATVRCDGDTFTAEALTAGN